LHARLCKVPAETPAGLNDREEALRRQIEPPQRSRHVQDDFTRQPMITMRSEDAINRQRIFNLAFGAQTNQPDLRLVDAQMQQRVIEFSVRLKRPVSVACRLNLRRVRRQIRLRSATRQVAYNLL